MESAMGADGFAGTLNKGTEHNIRVSPSRLPRKAQDNPGWQGQWPALRHGGLTWLWDSAPGIRHEKAKMSPQTQVWASPAHSPSACPSAIRGGD